MPEMHSISRDYGLTGVVVSILSIPGGLGLFGGIISIILGMLAANAGRERSDFAWALLALITGAIALGSGSQFFPT